MGRLNSLPKAHTDSFKFEAEYRPGLQHYYFCFVDFEWLRSLLRLYRWNWQRDNWVLLWKRPERFPSRAKLLYIRQLAHTAQQLHQYVWRGGGILATAFRHTTMLRFVLSRRMGGRRRNEKQQPSQRYIDNERRRAQDREKMESLAGESMEFVRTSRNISICKGAF